jgi:hypothetical protein
MAPEHKLNVLFTKSYFCFLFAFSALPQLMAPEHKLNVLFTKSYFCFLFAFSALPQLMAPEHSSYLLNLIFVAFFSRFQYFLN